ncbi:MAG TPA: hypothetical protein VJH22_07620 [Candidatus Nanoarchaeia archaeon]|nr:hypothetical protein [Candidatus Nanoarchaeia archaeon]
MIKSAIIALLVVLSACSYEGTSDINSTSDASPNVSTSYDLCLKEEQNDSVTFPGKISLLFYNETRENIDTYLAQLGDQDDINSECLYARGNLTLTSCSLTVPIGQEDHWVCSIRLHGPETLAQVVKEIGVVANYPL